MRCSRARFRCLSWRFKARLRCDRRLSQACRDQAMVMFVVRLAFAGLTGGIRCVIMGMRGPAVEAPGHMDGLAVRGANAMPNHREVRNGAQLARQRAQRCHHRKPANTGVSCTATHCTSRGTGPQRDGRFGDEPCQAKRTPCGTPKKLCTIKPLKRTACQVCHGTRSTSLSGPGGWQRSMRTS